VKPQTVKKFGGDETAKPAAPAAKKK